MTRPGERITTMPDDWSWFWATEQRRDSMLRNEIEQLQSTSSSARAQAARLSSQLTTLQGSLESRLRALSTAFDAYVELGDVREQLAGYPDTSAVRRDAMRAIAELGTGVVPDRVDDRGLDYWLPEATNEVVALTTGAPDGPPDLEPTGSPERELFVVSAVGSLGRGDRVARRVADLLVSDASLSRRQLVVWAAARDGVFGDGGVAEIGRIWRPALDLDGAAWADWCARQSRTQAPLETLRWLQRYLDGDVSTAPDPRGSAAAPAVGLPSSPVAADQLDLVGAADGGHRATPDPRTEGLRGLVRELVDQGYGDEAALLSRARLLRARVEHPTEPPPEVEAGADPNATVTAQVRAALASGALTPAAEGELRTWVRPGLRAAAVALAARADAQPAPTTLIRTEMGELPVTPDGVDPQRWALAETLTRQLYPDEMKPVVVRAAVAGVLVVLGAVLVGAGSTGLGVLTLVAAVVAGVMALRELLRVRGNRAALTELRERTRQRLSEARQSATWDEQNDREGRAEVAMLAAAIDRTTAAEGARA